MPDLKVAQVQEALQGEASSSSSRCVVSCGLVQPIKWPQNVATRGGGRERGRDREDARQCATLQCGNLAAGLSAGIALVAPIPSPPLSGIMLASRHTKIEQQNVQLTSGLNPNSTGWAQITRDIRLGSTRHISPS